MDIELACTVAGSTQKAKHMRRLTFTADGGRAEKLFCKTANFVPSVWFGCLSAASQSGGNMASPLFGAMVKVDDGVPTPKSLGWAPLSSQKSVAGNESQDGTSIERRLWCRVDNARYLARSSQRGGGSWPFRPQFVSDAAPNSPPAICNCHQGHNNGH